MGGSVACSESQRGRSPVRALRNVAERPNRVGGKGRARWRTQAMFALLAVGLVYVAVLVRAFAGTNMDPVNLAHISQKFPGQRFWDASTPFVAGSPTNVGYDGQFYYDLAHDPLLLGGPPTYLDSPSYRYQRLLYPALAYVLAFGQPAAIGWALLGVNVAGLALGCAGALWIIRSQRASPWWVVLYALNPGFLLALPLDLSDGLALGLCTAGLAAFLARKDGLSVFLLGLSVLTRETMVTVPFGLALWLVTRPERSEKRRALLYVAPLILELVWQVIVLLRVGALPVLEGAPNNVGLPFEGLWLVMQTALGLAPGESLSGFTGWDRVLAALTFATEAAACLVGVLLFHRGRLLRWQLALNSGFVLLLGPAVWVDVGSFPRAAALVFLFYTLVGMQEVTWRGAAKSSGSERNARC